MLTERVSSVGRYSETHHLPTRISNATAGNNPLNLNSGYNIPLTLKDLRMVTHLSRRTWLQSSNLSLDQ